MKKGFAVLLSLGGLALASTTALAQDSQMEFERLAKLCYELQDRRGLDACDRALEINPNNATLWTNRGATLHESFGRTQESLESHNRAIAIDADYSLALYNRCVAFVVQEQYDAAIDSCDRALEGDGRWGKAQPAEAWASRGVALRRSGRYAQALESYDRAIALKPDDALIWNNRGVALLGLGRFQDALAAFEQALKLNPNYELAQRNRAIALQQLGQ